MSWNKLFSSRNMNIYVYVCIHTQTHIHANAIKCAIVDWKSTTKRYRMVLEQMCMWYSEGYCGMGKAFLMK